MDIVMTVFALIGFIYCCLTGIGIVAIVWYEIREKYDRRKKYEYENDKYERV